MDFGTEILMIDPSEWNRHVNEGMSLHFGIYLRKNAEPRMMTICKSRVTYARMPENRFHSGRVNRESA